MLWQHALWRTVDTADGVLDSGVICGGVRSDSAESLSRLGFWSHLWVCRPLGRRVAGTHYYS